MIVLMLVLRCFVTKQMANVFANLHTVVQSVKFKKLVELIVSIMELLVMHINFFLFIIYILFLNNHTFLFHYKTGIIPRRCVYCHYSYYASDGINGYHQFPILKDWDLRLVNGNEPGEGIPELRTDTHSWGAICDDLWQINDAHVICRG